MLLRCNLAYAHHLDYHPIRVETNFKIVNLRLQSIAAIEGRFELLFSVGVCATHHSSVVSHATIV